MARRGRALALAGARKITVVNRSETRGRELVEVLRGIAAADLVVWTGEFRVSEDAAILVSGTSIGLYDETVLPPVAPDSLRRDLVVAEVVFNPVEPRLLRQAAVRGGTVLDGLGMVVNQGIAAVRHDRPRASAAVMRRALCAEMEL